MDMDRRSSGPRDIPAESPVGVAPRLAADRSGAQRSAVQERSDQLAAIHVRAGSVPAAVGATRVACGPALVFHIAGREAFPLSRLDLFARARHFHQLRREILLRAPGLS